MPLRDPMTSLQSRLRVCSGKSCPVHTLVSCHDPCDAPTGPYDESSITGSCLVRKTLRHTVFGVFPLLTPLKKHGVLRFRRHDVPLNVVFGERVWRNKHGVLRFRRHDVPLNVVFGERVWRNGNPRLESSRRLFLPAEVVCCLSRTTLRHTVFGVFPWLTPLKKTLFSDFLANWHQFPPNFP